MRLLAVLLLLAMAGCAANPRDIGITGPGQVEPPKAHEEALPGGDVYPRDQTPNTGNGHYWGYN